MLSKIRKGFESLVVYYFLCGLILVELTKEIDFSFLVEVKRVPMVVASTALCLTEWLIGIETVHDSIQGQLLVRSLLQQLPFGLEYGWRFQLLIQEHFNALNVPIFVHRYYFPIPPKILKVLLAYSCTIFIKLIWNVFKFFFVNVLLYSIFLISGIASS